jgi:NAD-dependent DNA ligase
MTTASPTTVRRAAFIGEIPNVNELKRVLKYNCGFTVVNAGVTPTTDLVIFGENCDRKLARAVRLKLSRVHFSQFAHFYQKPTGQI